ncbi:MAG: radical SAM protein, partial [Blautia obeum]
LLPGHVKDAKNVLKYLYETYGDRIYISMMNQYTPMPAMKDDPQLSRKVTDREYERLIDYAISLGLKNGFMQEGETAKESFIPEFDGEGV